MSPERPEEGAVSRVSVVRCDSYTSQAAYAAVSEAVNLLGGMDRFVSKGERVLLKPNMLAARPPQDAVTTHPEILRAAIRLTKEVGAVPVVGDSPAGPSTERILNNLARKTGIADVCGQEGVPFVLFLDYDDVGFPSGKVAKSFPLTKTFNEVDAVISLPKLKTHSFTGYTGAVKNCFGLVHGLKKAEYHLRMRTPEVFSEMLVDLAECVGPRLTIMDGVRGMDGDGPSAGRARDLGVVLASSSPHAMDLVAAEIVGIVPEDVWTLSIARDRGLLPANGVKGVEVTGESVDAARVEGFRMPPKTRAFGSTPNALGVLAAESLARKPVFDRRRCTACGSCVEICPAKALSIDTAGRVGIDRGACIRCYCCQEVCPEGAVSLRRMPLRSLSRTLFHS